MQPSCSSVLKKTCRFPPPPHDGFGFYHPFLCRVPDTIQLIPRGVRQYCFALQLVKIIGVSPHHFCDRVLTGLVINVGKVTIPECFGQEHEKQGWVTSVRRPYVGSGNLSAQDVWLWLFIGGQKNRPGGRLRYT